MTATRSAWRRLDVLLSRLEDDVLTLDDTSILSEDHGVNPDIDIVRHVLQTSVGSASIEELFPQTDQRNTSLIQQCAPSASALSTVPDNEIDLRALLETVVASQPSVPEHYRLAFAANRNPTRAELHAMAAHLVQLGLLKPAH